MVDFTGGTWRSLIDGQEVSAIPDSVVSRPDDNDEGGDQSVKIGHQIETKTSWPSIGARISNLTSGVTTAYLTDDNNNTIETTDISSLSAGDAFTFENVNLEANTKYRIVLDADGSDFTPGINNDIAESDFPFTSEDIDITARVFDGSTGGDQVTMVDDIGNTGFD